MTEGENGGLHNSELKSLDEHVGGILSEITTEENFSGKSGQSTYARLKGYGFKRVGLVGLGKVESVGSSTKAWKSLGESVASISKTAQATSVAVLVAGSSELSAEVRLAAASAITSGL